MAKSTQRRKQTANTTNKPSMEKATTQVVSGGERAEMNKAPAGLPKQGGTQNLDRILGDMIDPKVSAAATETYAKSKAIDSMCRVIENEKERTMEEKLDALDRENEIKLEAHRKATEDRLTALGIIGAIFSGLAGLGWLNRKGIIKLPPIQI